MQVQQIFLNICKNENVISNVSILRNFGWVLMAFLKLVKKRFQIPLEFCGLKEYNVKSFFSFRMQVVKVFFILTVDKPPLPNWVHGCTETSNITSLFIGQGDASIKHYP